MSWQRSQGTKKRYKRLHNETFRHYGSGVWYDEERNRYIRYWQPRCAKFVKRKCNRAVRRYNGALTSKGLYRKISEYWWDIW